MAETDFDIEFPPDSVVTDVTGPTVTTYVQRRDGTQRIITSAEEHATYERWLATESGMATAKTGMRGVTLLVVISSAAFVILLACLLRRTGVRAWRWLWDNSCFT